MPDIVPLKFAHDIDLLSPLNPLYIIGGGETPGKHGALKVVFQYFFEVY